MAEVEIMNAVTLKNAKENLEKLIEETIENAEPTIIATDSGQSVVFISLDEYNALKETLYLLSHRANAAHLRTSINEAKAGQAQTRALLDG
jgi:antitoxin YefM